MATDRTVAALRRVAAAHRGVEALLRQSGSVIRDEIRRNIDRSQNAGEFTAVDVPGIAPGEVFFSLSKYTIARRRDQGIYHEQPLKATGQMYRDIGVTARGRRRVEVGGTTARARALLRKHLGTNITGIRSTDLLQTIPPRNPVGYRQQNLRDIQRLWRKAFLQPGSIQIHDFPIRVTV